MRDENEEKNRPSPNIKAREKSVGLSASDVARQRKRCVVTHLLLCEREVAH